MVVATTLLVGGCAVISSEIPIDYVSSVNPATAAVPGAAGVNLSLTASDKRQQYVDRVSTKRNGYGMEMARIVSTKDVPTIVRDAVEQEFKARGFAIGPGGAAISIEVLNFYNDFRSGFLEGGGKAFVQFGIKMRSATGAMVYEKFYAGSGTEEHYSRSIGSNAKEALEKALARAVEQMADDRALQRALLTPVQPNRGS